MIAMCRFMCFILTSFQHTVFTDKQVRTFMTLEIKCIRNVLQVKYKGYNNFVTKATCNITTCIRKRKIRIFLYYKLRISKLFVTLVFGMLCLILFFGYGFILYFHFLFYFYLNWILFFHSWRTTYQWIIQTKTFQFPLYS